MANNTFNKIINIEVKTKSLNELEHLVDQITEETKILNNIENEIVQSTDQIVENEKQIAALNEKQVEIKSELAKKDKESLSTSQQIEHSLENQQRRSEQLFKVAEGIGGYFQVAASTQLLLGEEMGEALQKQQAKVLALIGLTDGLKKMAEGVVSGFKLVGDTIKNSTVLMRIFGTVGKFAMSGLGIGLIITAFVVIMNNLDSITNYFKGLIEPVQKFSDKIGGLSGFFNVALGSAKALFSIIKDIATFNLGGSLDRAKGIINESVSASEQSARRRENLKNLEDNQLKLQILINSTRDLVKLENLKVIAAEKDLELQKTIYNTLIDQNDEIQKQIKLRDEAKSKLESPKNLADATYQKKQEYSQIVKNADLEIERIKNTTSEFLQQNLKVAEATKKYLDQKDEREKFYHDRRIARENDELKRIQSNFEKSQISAELTNSLNKLTVEEDAKGLINSEKLFRGYLADEITIKQESLLVENDNEKYFLYKKLENTKKYLKDLEDYNRKYNKSSTDDKLQILSISKVISGIQLELYKNEQNEKKIIDENLAERSKTNFQNQLDIENTYNIDSLKIKNKYENINDEIYKNQETKTQERIILTRQRFDELKNLGEIDDSDVIEAGEKIVSVWIDTYDKIEVSQLEHEKIMYEQELKFRGDQAEDMRDLTKDLLNQSDEYKAYVIETRDFVRAYEKKQEDRSNKFRKYQLEVEIENQNEAKNNEKLTLQERGEANQKYYDAKSRQIERAKLDAIDSYGVDSAEYEKALNDKKELDKEYADSQKQLRDEQFKQGLKFADDLLKVASKTAELGATFNELLNQQGENEKIQIEKNIEGLEENVAKTDELLNEQKNKVAENIKNIDDLEAALSSSRGDRFDDLKEKLENERIIKEQNLIKEKQIADEKIKIEKKLEAEKKRIEQIDLAAKKRQQAISIVQATISGAQGVVAALGASPPPLNFVMASLVGAIAAANIAVIASQKFERGGLLKGNLHSNGGIKGTGSFSNIEVEGGEFVMNRKSTAKFLPTLEKMNKDGLYAQGGQLPNFNNLSLNSTNDSIQSISNTPIFVSVKDINDGQSRVNVIESTNSY